MSHGPSPNLFVSLDQFLDGIISLFITLQFLSNAFHFFAVLPFAAAFFAGAFLASGFLASAFSWAVFSAPRRPRRGLPRPAFPFSAEVRPSAVCYRSGS